MKGDFTRETFDPQKHYKRVLMQQGRVQLDADWNEQQAILQHRIETEARDTVGRSGAPADNPGFKIALQSDERLRIGIGRYYVEGVMCENDADMLYHEQPGALYTSSLREAFDRMRTGTFIVYLDAWEQHVTALDDPRIRETALGGPDTTTRVKTAWRVELLPVAGPEIDFGRLQELESEILKEIVGLGSEDQFRGHDWFGQLKAFTSAWAELPLETLQQFSHYHWEKSLEEQFRLIGLLHLWAARQNESALSNVNRILEIFERIASLVGTIGCNTHFEEWEKLIAPSSGRMNARSVYDPTTGPCLPPPAVGYQRLENQLYRVEIHRGNHDNPTNAVTFKWSRENGSVVMAIERIEGRELWVDTVRLDELTGIAADQWVEIVNDLTERDNHQAGQLVQVEHVDLATNVITLKSSPAAIELGRRYKLRLWNQAGTSATAAGVVISYEWLPLEDGIQVEFLHGTYRTGDYWLVPARTATGEIEWPPFEVPNRTPQPQPPLNARHRYSRLALLQLQKVFDVYNWGVKDCRTLFYPQATPAIHVLQTDWKNDSLVTLGEFGTVGLVLQLDDAPVYHTVNAATMIVTLEIPYRYALGEPRIFTVVPAPDASSGFLNVYQSVILRGHITSAFGWILWLPEEESIAGLYQLIHEYGELRVRVTLKGHCIWSEREGQRRYLDGQAFGHHQSSASGDTPVTESLFPSGAGARAHDFESWFYLAESRPGYSYGHKAIGGDLL